MTFREFKPIDWLIFIMGVVMLVVVIPIISWGVFRCP